MRKYAVPCIISLLVGALYNIVDQIFIANAAYLGSFGNAANTVVFPLTVIALAIAVMIGDGCCAFVSLSLGKGETDTARKSVGNSVVLMIMSSLLLMALYLAFSNAIIAMFGGTVNAETFHHSKEYFFYITLGIPFYMFGAANESTYYTDFAIKAFRIYLCMMVFACVNKACFIFMQAMGKAFESTALSMVREIVFGVGFALLLPQKYGLDGVFYSMPLSDLLTFLIAVILIIRTYRELEESGYRKEMAGWTTN